MPVGGLVATQALHESHRTVTTQVCTRLAEGQGPAGELGKDTSELEQMTYLSNGL